MKIQQTVAAIVLLGLTAVASFAGAANDPARSPATRTLAVIPFYSPERMWLLYTPFIDYLRRETGEPWELKLYPNHDSMIESICKGEVDVALLGPAPLGRVNRDCGVLPFLVPLGREGRPVYHSMLLTTDPAVTTTAGLRGKRVGFFKGSTAAHFIPMKMLHDAGLDPEDFESVFFESQDRIMTALLAHQLAGAGVKETLYRRFEKESVRLLQTSEALPNFAFSALPTQTPAIRQRFVAALLKLRPRENAQDAGTVAGWDDEIKNGFVAPAPDFLPAVLRVDEISRSFMHENR